MSATLTGGARRQLDDLSRARPEWAAWLRLLDVTLAAAEDPAWDAVAASATLSLERSPAAPLLTDAEIPVPGALADAWVGRLLATADIDLGRFASLALLEGAIEQDAASVERVAARAGVDPNALTPVIQLATMPLLQAIARRYGTVAASGWAQEYCPVCGAWPALAEQHGLDRERHLRCGRCGGDWRSVSLRCAFCGTTDHDVLGSLVPEGEGESRRVETCGNCQGYLKVRTVLRPGAGMEIPLGDLATVELDLAAVERDFGRPVAPAVTLGVRLVPAGSSVTPTAGDGR